MTPTSLPGRVVGLVMVHPAGFGAPREFGRREVDAHSRPRRLLRGLGLPVFNANGGTGGAVFPRMYSPIVQSGLYPVPVPSITFSTASGNTVTPAVGDTWTVTVTGVKPGALIAANGNVRGTADSSGSFTSSGTFTPDVVGGYQENWTADGVSLGVWNFSVVPAPAGLPGGVQPIQPGQLAPTQVPVGGTGAPSTATGTFLGLPIWVFVLAAGALFLLSYADNGGAPTRGRR